MNLSKINPIILTIISIVIGSLIFFIETFLKKQNDGSLLLTLTFWVALIQGPVAVAAAAEISQGKWVKPLKNELLAFYPLILFMAFIFLFLAFQMNIYPWAHNSHRWLNKNFFLLRNFILLLFTYLFARFFAKASVQNKKIKGTYALIYLLLFIICQTLVAFDWIMSLEFPWVSTMFAPIFFMESFYAGLALLAIIAAFFIKRNAENKSEIMNVLKDASLFIFGFALAWAGLYYGQFLVIWYGNIPWETSFFGSRMSNSPLKEMMYIIIIILFIVPFVGLLSKKAKSTTLWVMIISVLILVGLLIERLFYILPVLPLNPKWLLLEMILVGALFYLFFASRNQILKLDR